MFHTYVKEKNAKKEYRENAFLATAIEDVAKKYNVIKHKRNKGPIVLYDFNENKLYQKRTIRFIAREATNFMKDIRNANNPEENAAKHASLKQIRNLLNENSGKTTVSSIIILCVIFRLLQQEIDSDYYLDTIHESAIISQDYSTYCHEHYIIDASAFSKNCAWYFFGDRVERILEGQLDLPVGQIYLAAYIQACSDILDELVTDKAGIAIQIRKGYPEKLREMKDISANDFPPFPANDWRNILNNP